MLRITFSYKGYKLYNNNKLVGKFTSADNAKNFINKFMPHCINPNQIHIALNEVCGTNHNVIEFGTEGFFICSYYDKSTEE